MAVSMKEYLKKYTSGKGKKKLKKKPVTTPTTKLRTVIVDDDLDIKAIAPKTDEDFDTEIGDEAPVVVGVIDERPELVQKMELFSQKDKWRVLGTNNSDEDDNESLHSKKDDAGERIASRLHDDDQSPPRKRHDSGSDQSPPRKTSNAGGGCDSDQSPPRKISSPGGDRDSDQSPQRRKSSPHLDKSSPRRNDDSGSDQSSRRKNNRRSSPPSRRHSRGRRHRSSSSDSAVDDVPRTLDGQRAGLQNLETLRHENRKARDREKKYLDKVGDGVLGRHAETIVRDRASGRRRDFVAERLKKEENATVKAAREAKYNAWGKGLKQIDMQRSRLESDLHEMSKPLARYGDDTDLDKMLREQEREGDPMLQFLKKKSKNKWREGDDGLPAKEFPKYKGPPAPLNRYGIEPGYRWDGVERSNGFEASRFSRLNDRAANLEQAYKWSVEDM